VISAEARHLIEARRATRPWARLLRAVQRSTTLTSTGAAALVLALLLWGIGRILAGRALYLLAYGAVGLIGLAWMMSRRALPLRGDRTMLRQRMREGEVVEIGVTLAAQRPLTTLVLEEQLPPGLGQTVKLPIARLRRGENVDHRYQLTCWRRGAYRIGPLVVRYGDPIGLTLREQVVAEPFEILVHPRIERVTDRPLTRQFEDPPIRPPVSKPWPSGLEFYGMRDYAPGDDLRRVVWRAMARTGRLLVREAEQGITDRITIVLDTAQSAWGRDAYDPGFETAVRAAASLAVRHLGAGYAVTVEACGRTLANALRGSRAQIPMLDALARVERERAALAEVLRRLVGNARRDAHNVLVTARLDRSDAAQLRLLLDHGVSVLVVVVSYEGSFAETAHNAAALGCQVVEVRPGESLAHALALEVGAGSGRRR
jgi:uncharacterized protein (DUF58 family)